MEVKFQVEEATLGDEDECHGQQYYQWLYRGQDNTKALVNEVREHSKVLSVD